MTDEYAKHEHSMECECTECMPHEDDCECEQCYEQRIIEAERARADYIWEANQAAAERMANLFGLNELEGEE